MPLTWWAQVGSNHRPLACKASALPLSYAPSITAQVTGLRYPASWLSVNCAPVIATRGAVRAPGQAPGPPPRPARPPNPPPVPLPASPPRGPLVAADPSAGAAARRRRSRGASREPRISPRRHIGGGGRSGRSYLAAVAALDLAQPPYQADRPAVRAAIEIRNPVAPGLALRADQHLAVRPHPALPGARAPGRVHLPGTASITGHLADSAGIRPSRGRPAPSGNRRCPGPAGPGSRLSTAPRRPCR